MKTGIGLLIGIIGVAASGFGIGYTIAANHKMKAVDEAVGRSIDEMIKKETIDISQEAVNELIETEIKRRISDDLPKYVDKACRQTVCDVKKSIHTKISDAAEKAVNKTYSEMEDEAKASIKSELNRIDISDLKREVREEAAEKIAKKLDDSMDDILDDFNSNLKHIKTIYSSIAKSMTDD